MTFELTLDIDVPPSRVFAFVSDFSTMPQWYSAVENVQRVSGTGALGTRYSIRRQLLGAPARNDVEKTNHVENRQVTFTSISGPTPFVYRYSVEASRKGTRLSLEGTISGAGLSGPAALLGPLAEGLFKQGMRDNLQTLKRILERASRGLN
jgi:uncharacterized protein YndB with AHSA1/START domain